MGYNLATEKNSEKALKQKIKTKKHLNKKLPVVLVLNRAPRRLDMKCWIDLRYKPAHITGENHELHHNLYI